MVDGVHVRVTVGFDDGAAYKFIFIGFVCENESLCDSGSPVCGKFRN